MGFIVILLLTTLSIAGSAAFFSVYGLAQIFTGSFIPIVIMASSLEAGKLVTASYLSRFWDKMGFFVKTYLILAVVVLMVITSAGIFGFLSSAYQQDIMGTKINEQQSQLLEDDNRNLAVLKTERLSRKKQIDADISALPNNYVTGRERLMKSYGEELNQLKLDIREYTQEIRDNTKKIAELKAINLEQEAHIGPIIFIAKVFDQDIDNTTKWLILIIIIVFDPLAVMLTVATNNAIMEYKREKRGLAIAHESADIPPPISNIATPVEQTEELLSTLDTQSDKSPEDVAQASMLTEMINRKAVTEQLRTGVIDQK